MMDFLAKNKITGEITYLDILNDDYIKLTNSEIEQYNLEQQKQIKITELTAQIDELDKRRIRAIAEPSIKDKKTGETWLEYYTEQILDLRAKLGE